MYKYTKELEKAGMVKCPECPMAVEPTQKFCEGCGYNLKLGLGKCSFCHINGATLINLDKNSVFPILCTECAVLKNFTN